MKTRCVQFKKKSQLLKISRYPSWKFYNWVLYPSHSIYTSGGLWAPAMLLKNSPFTHFWCNNLAQFKVQFLVETVKQHAASSPWNHKGDLMCMSRILLKFPKLFLKYIISSNVDECQKSHVKIWYGKKYLIYIFYPPTIHIPSSQVLFSGLTIKTKSQLSIVVNFSKQS